MAGEAKFTGQTYGQATQQAESQQAVPTGAPPTEVQARKAAKPVTGLMAPTERPDEPITAGSPFGPGPNRVSFQPRKLAHVDEIEDQLSILYELYPNEGLALLLSRVRERAR